MGLYRSVTKNLRMRGRGGGVTFGGVIGLVVVAGGGYYGYTHQAQVKDFYHKTIEPLFNKNKDPGMGQGAGAAPPPPPKEGDIGEANKKLDTLPGRCQCDANKCCANDASGKQHCITPTDLVDSNRDCALAKKVAYAHTYRARAYSARAFGTRQGKMKPLRQGSSYPYSYGRSYATTNPNGGYVLGRNRANRAFGR